MRSSFGARQLSDASSECRSAGMQILNCPRDVQSDEVSVNLCIRLKIRLTILSTSTPIPHVRMISRLSVTMLVKWANSEEANRETRDQLYNSS